MIKINLGSGRNPVEGWINVDVDPRADVHADLRELPFDDAYADVVQAIHVIEHFPAWDTEKVLREWKRILKPGGKIILECPDLYKCAKNLVTAYEKGEVPSPRLTIWGFYGDPRERNPYMMHPWGFFPESLMAELIRVGFDEVRNEEPQTHMKGLRDMRVTGTKP